MIVEHIWRALRAMFLLLATGLWLYWDSAPEALLLTLLGVALLIDQFKGFIENKIEDVLHWKRDFNNWE